MIKTEPAPLSSRNQQYSDLASSKRIRRTRSSIVCRESTTAPDAIDQSDSSRRRGAAC